MALASHDAAPSRGRTSSSGGLSGSASASEPGSEAGRPLNLGLLMFIPYRAMENAALEALAEAGFDDITLAQARVSSASPGRAPG